MFFHSQPKRRAGGSRDREARGKGAMEATGVDGETGENGGKWGLTTLPTKVDSM